jgi:hypothetical protein
MSDLSEQIEQAAIDPQSVTADGQTVVDKSVAERILGDKYLAQKAALQGTDSNGNAKSPWGCTRPARVIPPGGV